MIYLDNAATTYPKPFAVTSALLHTLAHPHGNAGRGAHTAALCSADAIYQARKALSCLFGLSDERRVVFAKNATEALNLAFFGLLDQNGKKVRVLTSTLEHNSVLRPLYELVRRGSVELSFFEPSVDDDECLRRVKKAMRLGVDFVAVCVEANTTGQALPVRGICNLAKEYGARSLLDASQAAGHRDVTFANTGADYICFPAHKGLYGITGLGALLIGADAPVPRPLQFGGAGFDSENPAMPAELPEALEAGTLPIHSVAALKAGIEFVTSRGVENIGKRERMLSAYLHKELKAMDVQVYSPRESAIVLFNYKGVPAARVAEHLDEFGICVRAGMHCAPRAHQSLQTGKSAVRASFGAFNTEGDVEVLLRALSALRT